MNTALLLLAALQAPSVPVPSPASSLRHLVVLEHGPHWPASEQAEAMKVLRDHGAYVHELLARGSALLAGPAPDRAYGVLVLDVPERDEVERLLARDPAITAGVLVPEVRAFQGSRREDLWPRPELPATPPGLEPIRLEVLVQAPLAEVWRSWSTPEGAQAFLAPKVTLELAPMGALEVLWSPEAPPGQRGAEGLHVLAFVPERMLAFEWSAPAQFVHARPERTFVVVELEAAGERATRVALLHQGFAEQAARAPEHAPEWRAVRSYFTGAWPHVLAALERCHSGEADRR